jgi:uncharacterized membrane protein
MVGQSLFQTLSSQVFVERDGVLTNLGGLNGPPAVSWCTGPNRINLRGTIAGWSEIAGGYPSDNCRGFGPLVLHAVFWEKGVIKDLGTLPGDTSSVAISISPAGVVIGTSGNTVAYAALFYFEPQVVGRPFVWSQERGMEDLNELIDAHLGWVLSSVADINIWGQIVGTGTHEGQTHGFLLTPER